MPTCPKCGKLNGDNANFCTSCGYRFTESFTIPKGSKIMFGMPAEEKIPNKLLQRLEELFKTTDYVETAFFTQIYVPSSGEPPHGLVTLKLRKQFDTDFSSALGKIVKETIPSDQFVEIGSMSKQMSEWMNTLHVKIFYRSNS